MTNNNFNQSKSEIDLFEFVFLLWKNKWLLIIMTLISIASGFIYIQYFVKNSKHDIQTTTTNFILQENSIWSQLEIIETINRALSAAYNYESWTETNQTLSKHLPHNLAASLSVSENTHTLDYSTTSKQNLDAIISYLSFTAQRISNQIKSVMTKEVEIKKKAKYNQLKEINRAIQSKHLAYRAEITALENEITNKKIELEAAEEALDYITSTLTKEIVDTPVMTMHILELKQQIKIDKSNIDSLLERKSTHDLNEIASAKEVAEVLNELKSTQLNQKLRDLNRDLLDYIKTHLSQNSFSDQDAAFRILDLTNTMTSNLSIGYLGFIELDQEMESTKKQIIELEQEQQNIKSIEIIRLGKTLTRHYSESSQQNNSIIFLIFIIAGLIFGTVILFFKEEFIKRNKLERR